MSTERRLGISYSRFSDPKQAKGDSEDRQADDFRNFCTRHNLTPLREVFADRGRSGYKDEHRRKGRLGQLIAMAKDGRFEPGTVIVVEAWDRLGRLRPDKQTDLIAELLRTGVHIGICRLDDIFCEEDFGTHKWTTLAVFIQLAYQESKQKAERVAASWVRRRERARLTPEERQLLTSCRPAWLKVVNGKFVPVPERVAIVKRIFTLAASGYGSKRIIRTFEGEGIKSFGPSGKWSMSYISKILNDRRALGEHQPRRINGDAEGPVIPDYYPRIISEEDFLLARAGQEGRQLSVRPRDRKYVNVFQSLLTHARDGEGFMLSTLSGTNRLTRLILRNVAGKNGRAKEYTIPYLEFEEAILSSLREIKPADVLPREKETASRADVLRAKLKAVGKDIASLKEDLSSGYSKAISAVLREQEDIEEQTAAELQEELARSVKPVERAWEEFPGLVDLIRNSEEPDAVRLKIRTVLHRIVESIVVLIVPRKSYRIVGAQVFFVGGRSRHYLLVYQAAGNGRKGGWWPPRNDDVIDDVVADPEDLDLRLREHAQALERKLLALDLEHWIGKAGTNGTS